jgi:hypothetical protein
MFENGFPQVEIPSGEQASERGWVVSEEGLGKCGETWKQRTKKRKGSGTYIFTCFKSHMTPILLIQQIERLPIEGEFRIIDAVWEFPGLGVEVDDLGV